MRIERLPRLALNSAIEGEAGGMFANDPLAETFQREIIHTWHRIGGYETLARLSLKYLVFEFVIGAVSSYQSAATVTFEPGNKAGCQAAKLESVSRD